MLRINDIIFSFDILDKKFCCDLPVCQGSCCRYGDSGAPLAESEVAVLREIWPLVSSYISEEGKHTIEKQGTSVKDFENEWVTPLIGDAECAYTVKSGNMYLCGIEQAWHDGKISFRKPLSCHLFPARIKQYSDFRAVNYQELSICSSARKKGTDDGVYVYEFLREPLIRAFGEELYAELCIAAGELRKGGFSR